MNPPRSMTDPVATTLPESVASTFAILDFIRESALVRTQDGRICYWNDASRWLYGWKSEEVMGRVAHELFDSRHTEPLPEPFYRLEGDGWEGKIVRSDAQGNRLIIEAKWVLRRNDAGEGLYIVETGRDVTVQHNGHLSLESSEYRHRIMFNAMAASFWELDFTRVGVMLQQLHATGERNLAAYFQRHPEYIREMMLATRVMDINDQTLVLFGRGDKQEMLGSIEPFWPEASYPVFAEAVCSALARDRSYVKETRLRRIDGSEFDALFTCAFPPESMAKGLFMTGVLDLSARNRAFAALEQSEFRYRHLFQIMAVAFWQVDSSKLNQLFDELRANGTKKLSPYIDDHPQFLQQAMEAFITVDVNERSVTLFGAKDRSELLGPITPYWIPEQQAIFRQSIEAAFDGAPGYQAETKMLTIDGREIDVLFFVTAPPEMRSRGMVLVGYLDISDQVATRNKLTHMRSELAHSARISMLGELTASIAHEVNQPLAAITTNGEASLRWLARTEPNVEEVRKLAERIVADARRAATIISRIRSMATHRATEEVSLPINSVIREAVTFLNHELQAHGVTATLQLARKLPDVCVDRTLMQQVIVNLMVNAIQAMSEVERTHKEIVLRTQPDGDGIQLAVTDNGPGISDAHMGRLFDSFFTSKACGMGMGLPICRSIVESFGGSISAGNDRIKGGACFTVSIPVRECKISYAPPIA